MAIQIKNKYLKRLLKKSGVVSKKMGGSSNDIKKIMKGGGACSELLQKALIERGNFLFKKALITKVHNKLFDIGSIFTSESFGSGSVGSGSVGSGSLISFRSFGSSEESKSSIDELLTLIDDRDFSDESGISQVVQPRIIKREKNIKVGENQNIIVLKYYNFDSDDDPDAIHTGAVEWSTGHIKNIFKGSYKMNNGEPFFISGTLQHNEDKPIYILNGVVIDEESQSSQDLVVSSLSADSNSFIEANEDSKKQEQEQQQSILSTPQSQKQKQQQQQQQQQKQQEQQQQQKQQEQQQKQQKQQQQLESSLQSPKSQQNIRSIPYDTDDSTYDFDNLPNLLAFQNLQIANTKAKLAEENAKLQALEYEKQLIGIKRLPPIGSNIVSGVDSHIIKTTADDQCPSKDLYPKTCTSNKHYKKQALLFHPDRNSSCNDEAIAKFQVLNTLCPNNGEKQKDYDTVNTSDSVPVENHLLLLEDQREDEEADDNSKLISVITEADETALSDNETHELITQYELPPPVDNSKLEDTGAASALTGYIVEFKTLVPTKDANDNIAIGRYNLESKAGDTQYYSSIEKDGSLTDIIQYHNQNPNENPIQSSVDITSFINSGTFNLVYKTTDPTKVFRILKPSKHNYLNNELYGLIVQYYFTKKCTEHVCKVFDFGTIRYHDKTLVYAILEAADFNMFDLFRGSEKKEIRNKLSLSTFKQIFNQLYEAINCIHAAGFIHSDVKPENVGIITSGNTRPILLDFGLTVKNGKSCIGKTQRYVPENYNIDGKCLQQIDLYAFGMMLLEILFILVEDFGTKLNMYLFFSNKFKSKDELLEILNSSHPSPYYKVLCGNISPSVEEIEKCRSFISSLLYSVFNQPSNISTIDDSWLKTRLEKIVEGNEDSSTSLFVSEATNLTDSNVLGNTIATAIESALKSDNKLSVSDIASGSQVTGSTYDSANILDETNYNSVGHATELSSAIEPQSVPSVTSVASVASESLEFTGGFLLVCPSSKKVVSIFNYIEEKKVFDYDNNIIDNKLSLFTQDGTIETFIEQINKFIKQPTVCSTDINTKTDTLTTLFANGFMNGLLSKGSNIDKGINTDTLTTLFANGFMNGLLSKGSNIDTNTNKDTLTTLFANGFIRALQPVV